MSMLNDEMHYRVMRLLEANPEITQRDVARELGVSLGKANYSVRALIRKGWVKAISFKNAQQKAAYLYCLTRRGRQEKARLTVQFVANKMREYEGLLVVIDEMQRGLQRRSTRLTRSR
jgi:MarR family transcriptional regulator, temperature-dependent positive regulator of motility